MNVVSAMTIDAMYDNVNDIKPQDTPTKSRLTCTFVYVPNVARLLVQRLATLIYLG